MKRCCSVGCFFSKQHSGLVLNTQQVHVGKISVSSKEAFRSLYSGTVIGAIGRIDIIESQVQIFPGDDERR